MPATRGGVCIQYLASLTLCLLVCPKALHTGTLDGRDWCGSNRTSSIFKYVAALPLIAPTLVPLITAVLCTPNQHMTLCEVVLPPQKDVTQRWTHCLSTVVLKFNTAAVLNLRIFSYCAC